MSHDDKKSRALWLADKLVGDYGSEAAQLLRWFASAPSARGAIIDGKTVGDEKRIVPYFPTWQMKEAGGETLLQMVKEFAPESRGLNAMQLAEGIYMEMLRHIPGLPYPENIGSADGGADHG